MSLTRSNIIAWLLLLAAAVSWAEGRNMLQFAYNSAEVTTSPVATTVLAEPASTAIDPSTEITDADATEPGYLPSTVIEEAPFGDIEGNREIQPSQSRGRRILGYALCLAAIASGFFGVFVLFAHKPLLGTDGALLLSAMGYWFYSANGGTLVWIPVCFAFLLSAREIWSWILNRFDLKWCASLRLADRCRMPQLSMLVLLGAVILPVAAIISFSASYFYFRYIIPELANVPVIAVLILVAVTEICCIWKYGADLHHLKRQLTNFREGKAISVGKGSFASDEALLQKIRTEHEQAVQAAVTSERFKVELISNVSHDLRTPLTSILGYGELLEKEVLTDNGKEQLTQLNRKAGYMRDLVDSLFELTKVSSGVLESKKEQIDLIRLLEQTLGLFDDQLTAAGLEVRRHYCADSVPVYTDGARMHQVFANLLGNAIKYALKGTRIHLEVKEHEEHYSIRMINTASYDMDFDPEQILQRFARGDKARTGQGSGLGLAIAQTYTESVGGSFRVAIDGDQFSAIACLPKY